MDRTKPATATRNVVRSILYSIAIVFAIIGSVKTFLYSDDGMYYYYIAIIFGILWGAAFLIGKLPRSKN